MYEQPQCLPLLWATQKVHWNTMPWALKLQTRRSTDLPLLSFHHLKILWVQHLEIFSTSCLLESGIQIINLCFPFIFIEIFFIKCLPTSTIQQKAPTTKSQEMIQLVLNEQKAIKWEVNLHCSSYRKMSLLSLNKRSNYKEFLLDQTLVRFLNLLGPFLHLLVKSTFSKSPAKFIQNLPPLISD